MASRFAEIQQAPPIEVFAVSKAFTDDTNEKKVNLSVGAYRTDDGKPWVLPVVRKVESEMAQDESLNHEYLPILGFIPLTTAATRIVLGEDSIALKEGRATGVQTLSGTGGLRVAADFLGKVLKYSTFTSLIQLGMNFLEPMDFYRDFLVGDGAERNFTSRLGLASFVGQSNHKLIFLNAGFANAKQYRYWDEKTRGLDFDGMVEDLKNAPENSVIILHACAHNPTGVDPSHEQWEKLADIIEEKKLFPLFDSAYQGFASGDLDNDAWAIRYFVSRGFELIITQSFAKNFGLYNERIGNMVVVVKDASVMVPMRSQITLLVRGAYSNPPNHGARIVSKVLNDTALFAEWKGCIQTMSSRIKEMRAGLRERLEKLGTPGSWDHITKQIGMFSYTGLTAAQAKFLAEKYHVYLLSSGRINMCGVNTKNIDYLAEAIDDAVKNVSG